MTTRLFVVIVFVLLMHTTVKVLAEILYPRYCLICHKKLSWAGAQDALCLDCSNAITLNTPPFCKKCGKAMPRARARGTCGECEAARFHFERAWASCVYKGVIREMIHNFKYNHKLKIEKYLSALLLNFIRDYHIPVAQCDFIIPVPLSSAKLREREFNQSQLLANTLASHLGLELMANNLKRLREGASQAELDKASRWKNIQGAFGVQRKELVKGKDILLIDDVLTTGATASEAAKALKNAGAKSVFVLTVAS